MDPVGVAGLAIAVFDQLIKLGERTAVLISDIRAYDEDTTHLHDRVVNESNKTITLRQLLFENASIYGGETLFEQFESDIQDQIIINLRRLKAILGEGKELLEQRYGSKSSAEKASQDRSSSSASNGSKDVTALGHSTVSLTLSPTTSSTDVSRKNSTSPLHYIRWSVWDKKRVETIVRNYKDLNSELHDQIKFYCNASVLGVDLGHLQRLQNDTNSRALGFDVDANLRLAAYDNQTGQPTETFELQDPSWSAILKDTESISERFSIASTNGRTILLEKFAYDVISSYPSQTANNISPRSRSRVDALAKLLRQPKEQVFRIPRCIGWKYLAEQKSIAFVFETEGKGSLMPVDLLQLLGKRDVGASLGDKFTLALGLAKCISQLHMVKWVHESFRSENILFFPAAAVEGSEKSKLVIDYKEPWVLGFEYSRPDIFKSTGVSDYCASRDVYRHPERQGEPEKAFTKLHDIYALGVVLLEIGLWEPALTFERHSFAHARDPYAIQKQLIKYAKRRLESKVGKKYRDVVLGCLSSDFNVVNDTKEDLKLQQAFRRQVVDVLELAANNV